MQATSSFTSSNLGSGSCSAGPSCARVLAVALSQILRCPWQGLKRSRSTTAAACAPTASSVQNPYMFCRDTCTCSNESAVAVLKGYYRGSYSDTRGSWDDVKEWASPDDCGHGHFCLIV